MTIAVITKSPLCANCRLYLYDHADNKCLYEPSHFEALLCIVCDNAIRRIDVIEADSQTIITHFECIPSE